jgi:hypothetical protein
MDNLTKEMTMATGKEGNKQSGGAGSGTSNRGFASMDPQRQREIASEGGKAAHEKGTAHEFTSEEARRAGSMSHGNRQAAQTSAHAGSGSGKQEGNKQEGKQEGNKQEARQEANKQEAKPGSKRQSSKDDSGGGSKSR